MLKRIEIEALRADLAAVEAVLANTTESEDPVGWLQFSRRKEQLQHTLEEIGRAPVGTAAVGLFFGGRPVLGSRGILADFGGKAVEHFQEIVSTRFASLNGSVGSRGPIGQRDRTQLMITDVARGSFGFVLEELEQQSLIDTPLKMVVDETVDLIYKVSSPDEGAFEEAAELVDDRVLGSLQSFFKLLDTSGAVLRLVDTDREFSIARDGIERARERVEGLSLSEFDERNRGVLYVLPDAKKFELHVQPNEIIRGNVAKSCVQVLLGSDGEVRQGIIGRVHDVVMRVRVVRVRNREPRSTYVLTEVHSLDSVV